MQYSEKFDRPVFAGRKANGSVSTKGGPKQSFLDEHLLDKDSSPTEFMDAFFPMYSNRHTDSNGDEHLSMQYLARCTNLRARLSFAGNATYSLWSGDFSIKELRGSFRIQEGLSQGTAVPLTSPTLSTNLAVFCHSICVD